MTERLVGEILTDTRHMGEYIAVRARINDEGIRIGKLIESDSDPEVVHARIRRDVRDHTGTGANFTYYFYKPFKLGDDREGWMVNGSGERQ